MKDEGVDAKSEFGPGVGGYGIDKFSAFTLLRGRIIDRCPHRHRTRNAAIKCAEMMCAVRNAPSGGTALSRKSGALREAGFLRFRPDKNGEGS